MTTVAIIAEYNPFHTGHSYHIQKIKEEFGSDTTIIAIMSGNFTQRGDVAFTDKLTRATCAVMCGVNLVLELPFPYSCASADIFARGGVTIAQKLGNVDYLSFGSESGCAEELMYVADITLSQNYCDKLGMLLNDTAYGYAKCCQLAYEACSDNYKNFSFSPNNILAIEYIKAIKKLNSNLKIHTVKREGADYNSDTINHREYHQSASAIRKVFCDNTDFALEFIPMQCRDLLKRAYEEGALPCSSELISSAILSHYRLSSGTVCESIHDAGAGLYNRLINASFEADSISSLLSLTETKKYTNARIRRAMWYGFLGVTSSDVETMPLFTQVLAMDKIGSGELKAIRKTKAISVLTKPSNYDGFEGVPLRQKILSEKADSIFELTRPTKRHGNSALMLTPFVKK